MSDLSGGGDSACLGGMVLEALASPLFVVAWLVFVSTVLALLLLLVILVAVSGAAAEIGVAEVAT